MSSGIKTAEVEVGAHRVFWGPAGSETELGLTAEGSVIRIEQVQNEVPTEEYGIAPVKKIMGGERVTCELIMLQWDNEQLKFAVPGSADGTGTATTSWNVGRTAGIDLSGTDYAKRLRLHPSTQTNTATQDEDHFIHLCIPAPAPIEARFNNREARAIGVIAEAIPDTTLDDGKRLYRYRTDSN